MTKNRFILILLMLCTQLSAEPIEFFMPKGEMFDSSIPSPEAVLGQALGDRHLRHDQIISYLSILSSSRNEAKLIDYGQTNEGRRLLLLAISSAENLKNLEQTKADPNILKIWNGFSIHGDESSGSNASVLYAWYLLASNNNEIKAALDDTIVLIDPSINPDGLSRFTTYVNNNRSLSTVSDPNDISHVQHWPTGRTNHYWFDLNRDWLLLTQTESKARMKQFHQWQPHVLTDHHEMGASSSFFFQPGVPSRKNPLITDKNLELTNKLAEYHAKALDEIGQSYYSKESFDDFYPGKGSTYPDLQGSVGILFEQAESIGGVVDTPNGQRSLAKGIRNQFLTARSTLRGALANRQAFIDYKNTFFSQAMQNATKLSHKGYLIDVSNNAFDGQRLAQFFDQHQIKYANLATDRTVDDHSYPKNRSLFVTLNQPQTTLVQSLFSTDTSFNDNTFYDVSSWNLGMAWGLPWTAVNSVPSTNDQFTVEKPKNSYQKNAVAYAFDWNTGNAGAALNYLIEQGAPVQVSSKDLNIDGHQVPAGSFVLAVDKNTNQDQLFSTLSTITDAFQVQWHPLTTALADEGIDLGSNALQTIKKPKVMMLVGSGTDPYQAGSLWHLFDTQIFMPITKVDLVYFHRVNLHEYTHIIMPSGRYDDKLDAQMTGKLQNWVKSGGHLIAIQQAALWVEENLQKVDKQTNDDSMKNPAELSAKDPDEKSVQTLERKAYGDYEQDAAEKVLGGAIVSAHADLTHPLAFGTHSETQYALMKGDAVLRPSDNAYNTPLRISKQVKAAGYVSDYWLEKLKDAPLVLAEKSGQGTLIKFGFNPNFRSFWYGTQRWLINAIFQAGLIKKTDQ
jgi:hypothetical protein